MNKVKRRAMSALLVAVLVLGGIGVYIVRYIEHGAEWATFAANSSVYTSGVLNTGTLTDRSGVVLATASGGSRSYAEDAAVRKACYQAVGDYAGNIGTGALKAFSKQLSGYNPITGTYATDGHTVALTLDSSLCVTAYEALAGRKGAVLVSNYKTGEVLCMVSGPSIDPAVDGDVPDGAYINRCINGSFTPGSIFKLITSAAAIENIKDIDSRRFTCAGSVDVAGVTVKCTGVHGSQTFEDALANSCNCAFAQISLELGADTIESYAKKFGFLDKTIKRLAGVDTLPEHPAAAFKMVDTCAAEFAAKTPYFYSTFDEDNEAKQFIAERSDPKKKKVLVFGSGPIRIGQGIEFDYCSVHAVWTLKNHGCEAVLVNNNPETVSTDFDTGDRLYFDPLNPESVDNIIATEKPDACVVQFGGQTAIKLAKHMDEIGLPILGTPADAIDEAEDRERFDELLERCKIPRAPGRTVFNLDEALTAADEIGLPVLMRPSYVLGGQNMIVAYTKADVIEYMGVITEHVDMDHPVLLDKYIMGTECEVDAICDGENFLIPGIMEQVERTGVHSGDSVCVYPAQHLTQAEIDTMVDYTGRFARELHVNGLVNVQYAVSNGKVYVIEVNPRSSRTVPYISKVTGVPMVDLAVRCCLGEKLVDMGYGTGLHPNAPYVAVKVPVFSFEKLHGVDTQFGPEMKSTGEVLGIAPNYHDALLKGLIGAGYTFKTPGPASCCIFTVKDSDKPEFVDIAWKLKSMGYKLYGTSGTCAWLNKHMVPCNEVRPMSGESPNIVDLLQSGLVDYVFSTSAKGRDPKRDSVRLRRKAVELSIPCVTAVDTANALVNCLRSDHSMKNIPLVDIATLYHKN